MHTSSIKNLLFDLDGTIIESQKGIINSILYALNKMHIPRPLPETLTHFIGPPLLDSFQQTYQLSNAEAAQAVTFFRVYFSEKGIHENHLYPGIANLLHTLHQHYQLFIATSKPTIFAQQILVHHNLHHLFNGIVGSTLDHSRTNKTDIVRYVLDTYLLHPQETLMIGDRKFDVIGAKANDLPSIGVTYGHGTREELKRAQANTIVNDCIELQKLLCP